MRALSLCVWLWVISVFLFYLSVFANLSTVDVLYDEESECRRWNYSVEKERDPRGPSSLAQSVRPAPQVFSAFPQDSAAPGTRLWCAFPPLRERQWQGGRHGDCRGLPPGWAAPTDRGDPGPLQSHQGDAAGGEKEDAGRDGTGAGQADAWQGCGQDVALLRPEHSWWDWWGPELGAHTCLLLLIPAAGAAGRLASPGDTLTLVWVAWFWQELETHSNLSKIFFWCGPLLKSLLNLLQCCFCLCFVFLTMRDVES